MKFSHSKNPESDFLILAVGWGRGGGGAEGGGGG